MAVATLLADSVCANPPADTDAMLLDILRRWKSAVDLYESDPRCGDDPEGIKLIEDADDIVAEALAIPATGLIGLAIKMYFSHEQGLGLDRQFMPAWCGDRQEVIGAAAMRDAMRLAPDVAAVLNLAMGSAIANSTE